MVLRFLASKEEPSPWSLPRLHLHFLRERGPKVLIGATASEHREAGPDQKVKVE